MATSSTIPGALRDLFDEPALAHVSYLNRKGQIVTYPMWVDFDGEHLVVSSPVGSRKGKAFREQPQVAVSIVRRIDGADHTQAWNVDPKSYEDALTAFLTEVGKAPLT